LARTRSSLARILRTGYGLSGGGRDHTRYPSGLFALLNRGDRDHERVRAAHFKDRGPYLVPAGIFAEIAYLVEERLDTGALESLLLDLESGGFTLE